MLMKERNVPPHLQRSARKYLEKKWANEDELTFNMNYYFSHLNVAIKE